MEYRHLFKWGCVCLWIRRSICELHNFLTNCHKYSFYLCIMKHTFVTSIDTIFSPYTSPSDDDQWMPNFYILLWTKHNTGRRVLNSFSVLHVSLHPLDRNTFCRVLNMFVCLLNSYSCDRGSQRCAFECSFGLFIKGICV